MRALYRKYRCRFIGLLCMFFLSNNVLAEQSDIESQYNALKKEFSVLNRQSHDPTKGLVSTPSLRIIAISKKSPSSGGEEKRKMSNAWKNLTAFAVNNNVKIHRKLSRQNMLALEINESQLDKLVRVAALELLIKDEVAYVNLTSSTPFVGADKVHSIGFGGEEHAVAILDTGVDATHTFLGNRIVEEACFSSGDNIYNFSLCPNGETTQFGLGAAADCTDRYPILDCLHGTHVAGIAAGKTGAGFSGIAPRANIVAVQIFTYFPWGRLGAYLSDQVAALDWLLNEATTPNIAAINMSLGGGYHTSYCDELYPQAPVIQALREKGIATIIASGNNGFEGGISAPACISSAVAVGSTLKTANEVSSFSNSSMMVDLLAPGTEIVSSTPGGGYEFMSGTSMATPHVTGAFATLKSVMPEASVDQIENALESTGISIFDAGANVTMPRIDVFASYELLFSTREPVSCDGVPSYTDGHEYRDGEEVQNTGNYYRCKVSGWCSTGGSYAPGVGWAWADAWTELGRCL